MRTRLLLSWLAACVASGACNEHEKAVTTSEAPAYAAASDPLEARHETVSVERSSDAEQAARAPSAKACADDMLSVAGNYCSKVSQVCLREQGSHRGHPTRSERCLSYAQPSVCEGTRKALAFCIDRFEWPNRVDTAPLVLVSWREAGELCARAGKRLCTEEEWTLACEGEQMLPYTLGYKRPVDACAIDLPYREPQRPLLQHSACLADPVCGAELDRIDQRRPARADSACFSPFGAVDMNGNVNEWVDATAATYPYRGALKGGWWGPVRNRCRPAVHQHREDHWGYEIGFRCCRNPDENSVTPRLETGRERP